jgi:hypothetical protein
MSEEKSTDNQPADDEQASLKPSIWPLLVLDNCFFGNQPPLSAVMGPVTLVVLGLTFCATPFRLLPRSFVAAVALLGDAFSIYALIKTRHRTAASSTLFCILAALILLASIFRGHPPH